MSNAFIAPHFQRHEAAREWLESLRWPDGPVCSHCGTINHAYKTKKPGWYPCAEKERRKDFTGTTRTVMGHSHVPLNKLLMMAFYLLNSSKKGMSAHKNTKHCNRLGVLEMGLKIPRGEIPVPVQSTVRTNNCAQLLGQHTAQMSKLC